MSRQPTPAQLASQRKYDKSAHRRKVRAAWLKTEAGIRYLAARKVSRRVAVGGGK